MRYFIVTVIVIFLMLVGAIVLVSRGRDDKSNDPNSDTTAPRSIVDYVNNNSEVRFTIDGKVVGDDQHRAIRISIAADKRELEIIQGYDGTVIKRELWSNDRSAYDVFLHALNTAQFNKIRENQDTDEKGKCPTGRRYIYELFENGVSVKRVWTTSCSTSQGTFAGNNSLAQTLFQQQIPEYGKHISGVNLN